MMKKIIKAIVPIILSIGMLLSAFSADAATYESFAKNPVYSYGVDVSQWNGDIDWDYLRDIGVEFAYIRVGYYGHDGGTLDKAFKTNVKGCVESGIDFGIYVYSYIYTYSDSVKMADWVHKQLKSLGNYTKDTDTIQVAYDIEDEVQTNALYSGRISADYLHNSVKKFCNRIKSHGYIPTIYSSESFFRDVLDLDDYQKSGINIWYAQWPYYPDPTIKKVMFNGTSPHAWQFADNYTIRGTCYDSNACYTDFYDYSKEDSTMTANLAAAYKNRTTGVKPKPEIYDGSTKLKAGEDYNLYYYKNKLPGRARIKAVRFKDGKYLESKTFIFYIKPDAVKSLKAAPSYDNVKLTWKPTYGATSYLIYEKTASDTGYYLIDEVKSTSYIDGFLDEGTSYGFKIIPVMSIDGKRVKGTSSVINADTTYKSVKFRTLTSDKKGQATLTWTPQKSNTKGYIIEYSTDKAFKTKSRYKVYGIDKSNAVIKGLSSKTRYYFRVRSYNSVNQKAYYSDYSIKRSVTIK